MRLAIFAIAFSLIAASPACAVDAPEPVGSPHLCNNYPPPALEADASGDAVIAFDVGPDGSVANTHVEKTTGNADLDAASMECVSQWRYQARATALSWKAMVQWRIDSVMPRAPATAPHLCNFEPAADERDRITDRAAAQFLVEPDGTTGEIMIARSSGDPLLDQAFSTCVASWKYMPATRNGAAIQVSWAAQMEWTQRNGVRIGENGAKPHMCFIYPANALRNHVEGTTVLSFIISEKGHVEEPAVAQSSGSSELDGAAITCSTHWKYLAATQDGKPMAIKWQAQVTWRNGHAFMLELQPSEFWKH